MMSVALVVSDAGTGLSVDVRVRMLVVHQAEGFCEHGVAVSLSYNPTPSTPLGFAARLAPSSGGLCTHTNNGRGNTGILPPPPERTGGYKPAVDAQESWTDRRKTHKRGPDRPDPGAARNGTGEPGRQRESS